MERSREPALSRSSGRLTLMQAVALAKGTSEDANPHRVAIFRTIGGQAPGRGVRSDRRSAAARRRTRRSTRATSWWSTGHRSRRSKAAPAEHSASGHFRAVLSERPVTEPRGDSMNNGLAVPNEGSWPIAPYRPPAGGSRGQGSAPIRRPTSSTSPTLLRIIHHWRWLVLGAVVARACRRDPAHPADDAGLSRLGDAGGQSADDLGQRRAVART